MSSRAHMSQRRNVVLDFLKAHPECTCQDISKATGIGSTYVSHALKTLIYGGAAEHTGSIRARNTSNKSIKLYTYKATGNAFDPALAQENIKKAHTTPPEEPLPSWVRPVKLLDKPCQKHQEGQGSGHHKIHIGCGSWGLI